MKTKSILLFLAIILSSSISFAGPENGDKKSKNTKKRQIQSYELRTEIMTEFNLQNARQVVNLDLDDKYKYQFVAIGDENVEAVAISISKTKKGDWDQVETGKRDRSMSVYDFEPVKSSTYKLAIEVSEFSAAKKGFVSFLVLRKG